MESQTWLSCLNKSISMENITRLSVSLDDFLRAILEDVEQTENLAIFSAEINLLWQLNQVWVSI